MANVVFDVAQNLTCQKAGPPVLPATKSIMPVSQPFINHSGLSISAFHGDELQGLGDETVCST